ncbi:hypothetical protein SLEP1_g53429 [Rubroshorea leprosula]|uniref:Uncharacterized protein n=1 Tax=Rubroshorea leprosula TaxID=152421 RepID=A0AAV5M9J1_9ROSI|nr:hypothetical protein SLEP1_g53429 [Rubroshorea leprosula]
MKDSSTWCLQVVMTNQALGNDGNQDDPTCTMSRDPIHILGGPITRARARKMRKALNGPIE